MADDGGGGSPAEQGRPFPFLRRGDGSQKYNKINYITRAPSAALPYRNSASSTSSGFPSTSTYVDVDIARPPEVPPLTLSPQMVAAPDSGRGSAAPHEQIYAMPSNRSVESGYGGFNVSTGGPSPDRTGEVSPTLIKDYSSFTRITQVADASTDDEVFHPDDQNAAYQSPALESFVRNERAVEQDLASKSVISTPSRELREGTTVRRVRHVSSSDSSAQHGLSHTFDQDSLPSNDGPLSSTPMLLVQPTETATVLPPEGAVPKAETHVQIETPIMGEATPYEVSSYELSSGGLSSPTTVPQSYQVHAPTDSSLSSVRRLIAKHDRPLHEAFPETGGNAKPVVRPSQATQYNQQWPLDRRSPTEDLLRREAMQKARARREAAVPSTTSSSDNVKTTPLRKLIPKATDPVVKEYRRELRNNVAHLDLGTANLRDGVKKLQKLMHVYHQKEADLDDRNAQLDRERELHDLAVQKEAQSIQKDRLNLKRREEEFRKLQSDKEKENKDLTVSNRASLAQMRVTMTAKDKEINRLKAEMAMKEDMKSRLERTLEQQRKNHERELKKHKEQINDLQKTLALVETDATKRRNGLQPRNTTTLPPQQDSANVRSSNGPSREEQHGHGFFDSQPRAQSSAKKVHFDEARNVVYKPPPSQQCKSDFYILEPLDKWDLPMGTCHHYWNVPTEESTYMYDLKHKDGYECGAKVFKFPSNDSKWVYGSLEIYLFHRFPLVVNIRDIEVEIKISRETSEIHRQNMEISCLDVDGQVVTEVLRRKDRSGHYAVLFSAPAGTVSSIYGRSDSAVEQDRMAMRRGDLLDKREYVAFNTGSQGYQVTWISERIPSARVRKYTVNTFGIGMSRIQVELSGGEIIDITACPTKDWVIIRHRRHGQEPVVCCDLGKRSRDRERKNIFVAHGDDIGPVQ